MEPQISSKKHMAMITTLFLLWDSKDGAVLRDMVDPDDRAIRPCILLFSSRETLRKYDGGRYSDEERYPLMVLDNKKVSSFFETTKRLKVVPLLVFEEEGKWHMQRMTGGFLAAKA
jgi:hypothetical protein